jgi:putative ABC transport system ATP-binding protein
MKELNRKEGTTFIFSTHDAKVMNHANAVVKLADGKILGRVSPAEAQQALAAGGH